MFPAVRYDEADAHNAWEQEQRYHELQLQMTDSECARKAIPFGNKKNG